MGLENPVFNSEPTWSGEEGERGILSPKTEWGPSTIGWWNLESVAFFYVVTSLPLSQDLAIEGEVGHVWCSLGVLSHHVLKGGSRRDRSQWPGLLGGVDCTVFISPQ